MEPRTNVLASLNHNFFRVMIIIPFSYSCSVQFGCSVMSNSLQPHGLQHARLQSWSLLKLVSIESVMPSNHLIPCHPLLLLPSIFPGIRIFSNESVLRIMAKVLEFQSVHSVSHFQVFVTPWTAARQASLSVTNSQSLLKCMSIYLVMPSKHPILCHPLLLPPSILPSIRVFSNVSAFHIRWPK